MKVLNWVLFFWCVAFCCQVSASQMHQSDTGTNNNEESTIQSGDNDSPLAYNAIKDGISQSFTLIERDLYGRQMYQDGVKEANFSWGLDHGSTGSGQKKCHFSKDVKQWFHQLFTHKLFSGGEQPKSNSQETVQDKYLRLKGLLDEVENRKFKDKRWGPSICKCLTAAGIGYLTGTGQLRIMTGKTIELLIPVANSATGALVTTLFKG